MDISLFDYNLPDELIAHEPAEPRDSCRLLAYSKEDQKIDDKIFRDIIEYFNEGDVLVLNNTKVIPSRLFGTKKETGGKLEVFLLKEVQTNIWEAMIRGKVTTETEIIFDGSDLIVQPHKKHDDIWHVRVNKNRQELFNILEIIGKAPLPPYIHSEEDEDAVRDKYQTVYSKFEGSVAAPTAGLHFTDELLASLKNKGVQIEYVTLHVGLGTFAPVRTDNILEHTMHAEYADVQGDVMQRIIRAKRNGQRVIAVGTTSVRVLESLVAEQLDKNVEDIVDFKGDINIFIYPGFDFKIIDGLITNFHLPKSTLLMLVSALVGQQQVQDIYKHAVDKKYKFYSFGDAMFIY